MTADPLQTARDYMALVALVETSAELLREPQIFSVEWRRKARAYVKAARAVIDSAGGGDSHADTR